MRNFDLRVTRGCVSQGTAIVSPVAIPAGGECRTCFFFLIVPLEPRLEKTWIQRTCHPHVLCSRHALLVAHIVSTETQLLEAVSCSMSSSRVDSSTTTEGLTSASTVTPAIADRSEGLPFFVHFSCFTFFHFFIFLFFFFNFSFFSFFSFFQFFRFFIFSIFQNFSFFQFFRFFNLFFHFSLSGAPLPPPGPLQKHRFFLLKSKF